MTIYDLNPYIRLATPSVLPGGLILNRRIIFDYELICVERGSFLLIYDEIEYRVTPGAVLLLRPGVPHSFYIDSEELSQPHIHFDLIYTPESPNIPISFKDIPDLTQEERRWIACDAFAAYPGGPFLKCSDREAFLSLFYHVIDSDTPPLEKKGGLTQLLSMIVADNFPRVFDGALAGYAVEAHVKNYIDAGQGWTMSLDGFAKQFSYSKFHLEKRFRRAYGVGLIAYRNQKRMELAQQLLCDHTVTETAALLGYQSIYVFSRAFALQFGISPNGYQKAVCAQKDR